MPTFKSYIAGFLLSVTLTLTAFFIVISPSLGHNQTILFIMVLAVIQLLVQLKFFLHIGNGPDKTANSVTLIFTVGLILIIAGGSLWIMNHLNYNMTPEQMNSSLIKMEGMGN